MIHWFTGISGSGKTTLALALKKELENRKVGNIALIDGDEYRKHLGRYRTNPYCEHSRRENVEGIIRLARYLSQVQKMQVIVACCSPFSSQRKSMKDDQSIGYIEIKVECPLYVCIRRDPKNIYAQFLNESSRNECNIVGYDIPYQETYKPDVRCHTSMDGEDVNVQPLIDQIMEYRNKYTTKRAVKSLTQ